MNPWLTWFDFKTFKPLVFWEKPAKAGETQVCSRGMVHPIVMKLGQRFNIRLLTHLTGFLILDFDHVTLYRLETLQIFNRKLGTERHLSQLFFVLLLFYFGGLLYHVTF